MKPNMGNLDRALRILFAIVVGILYFTGTIVGTAATLLALLAIVFLLTALVRFCPLYVPFKINTCERR